LNNNVENKENGRKTEEKCVALTIWINMKAYNGNIILFRYIPGWVGII
jgi:hypothetical protein